MSVPTDRKYSETHEWYQVDGDIVTLGITQFAADELTDITYVELPELGSEVTAGGAAGEIESVKATSELNCAVNGTVEAVNDTLTEKPELINEDAFGSGWMVKIKVADLSSLDVLMDSAAYEKVLAG